MLEADESACRVCDFEDHQFFDFGNAQKLEFPGRQ
jgi:hypothetical protein